MDSQVALLLPQVQPEAQAVIEGLQSAAIESSISVNRSTDRTQVAPLSHLTPWLLWNVMQISHEVVTLLEGCSAQTRLDQDPHCPWQTGMLRLVAILQLVQPQRTYQFDLVTQQSVRSLLPATTLIHLPNSILAPQPTSISTVLRRLIHQAQPYPVLHTYLSGCAADWLIPHHPWQSGLATIELGFEFIALATNTEDDLPSQDRNLPIRDQPTRDQPTRDQPTRDQSIRDQPSQPQSASQAEQFTIEQSHLKLAQSDWLEQHVSKAVEHQLSQVLRQSPLLTSTKPSQALTLAQIVEQGCAAIDVLQQSLTLASRIFAQQSLTLEQFGTHLLWSINRSAYEVMQWMSGLPISLLQPQTDWATGHLRFATHLLIQMPDRTIQWDLLRRSVATALTSPASESIVCSLESAWCLEPTLLSQLEQQIWETIAHQAPEIALLRSATEVTLTDHTVAGQLGVMRLIGAFEFQHSQPSPLVMRNMFSLSIRPIG
jgi:hypothetical protein